MERDGLVQQDGKRITSVPPQNTKGMGKKVSFQGTDRLTEQHCPLKSAFLSEQWLQESESVYLQSLRDGSLQTVPNLQWLNFMMVQKQNAFSRNPTEKFEFGSSPRYFCGARGSLLMLSGAVSTAPRQPHSREGYPLMR